MNVLAENNLSSGVSAELFLQQLFLVGILCHLFLLQSVHSAYFITCFYRDTVEVDGDPQKRYFL